MKRTAKIILDGAEYTVPALNIGQLERLAEAFELTAGRVAYAVLRIAMERSEPKIDVDLIEPSVDEVRDAFQAIVGLSGLFMKGNGAEVNPTQAGVAPLN